jgi:hypothetical protein
MVFIEIGQVAAGAHLWAMGVAHALANHRAQGALLQKPTHPAKQLEKLGSDPNSFDPLLMSQRDFTKSFSSNIRT